MKRILNILAICICCLSISVLLNENAYAQNTPIYFPLTGHYYQRVSLSQGATFFQSEAIAESMGGHLVTLNSPEENNFVYTNFGPTNDWLGGFQPDGSPEPDGNWQWVTGEPWSYTNWDPPDPNVPGSGEPNNMGGQPGGGIGPEEALVFASGSSFWNDVSRNWDPSELIVEYDKMIPVTRVTLNKRSLQLEVGNNDTLIATVQPINATNKNVTWTSSNNSVATVQNGTVKAISGGRATITVKTIDGDKTATCSVTVGRSADAYNAVLDNLDVEKEQKWLPSNGKTYCNEYAIAIMQAMGVSLPNYMNANAMYDWFSGPGRNAGWKQVEYTYAQQRANNGYPTFAIRKDKPQGHIAVVVPWRSGDPKVKAQDKWHYVYISQAGKTNYRYTTISNGWIQNKINFDSIKFYTHD